MRIDDVAGRFRIDLHRARHAYAKRTFLGIPELNRACRSSHRGVKINPVRVSFSTKSQAADILANLLSSCRHPVIVTYDHRLLATFDD